MTPNESDIAIQIMENYVSVEEYASLCGVPRRTVMDRIKARLISAVLDSSLPLVQNYCFPYLAA
ncbi:MAG: hypothetical protein U0T74_13790 [Chitinophagales bacterium]